MTALLGFQCFEPSCNWIGEECATERTEERDGLSYPYRVSVENICPQCRSYDVEEVEICCNCKEQLVVEDQAHCFNCIPEARQCEAENEHDRRREATA